MQLTAECINVHGMKSIQHYAADVGVDRGAANKWSFCCKITRAVKILRLPLQQRCFYRTDK
jgi:hypothetical protein